MPSNSNLAKEALHIMDEDGEQRMMVFVWNNSDTRPAAQELNLHSLSVLRDHTAVAHSSDKHTFLWNETDGDGVRLETRARPAGSERHRNPALPKGRRAEVEGAPSYENLMWHALKKIEGEWMEAQGIPEPCLWAGNDPLLDNDEAAATAPSLLEETGNGAAKSVESDELWLSMDDYTEAAVTELLAYIVQAERAALTQAIAQAWPQQYQTEGNRAAETA